jgi:hypothetical protein
MLYSKTNPLELKYLTYTVSAFSSRRFMVHKDNQRTQLKSEEIKDGISKKKTWKVYFRFEK